MTEIHTIGQGNHSIKTFIELLCQYNIKYLIDVRSRPYSKYNSDFSKAAFAKHLRNHNIQYVYMGDVLGGMPHDESLYTNGKADYNKIAASAPYQQGLERLKKAATGDFHVAIMCAEAKPEHCHRTKLISETLDQQNIAVYHIDETGNTKSHKEIRQRIMNELDKVAPEQLGLFNDTIQIEASLHSRKKNLSKIITPPNNET